MAHDFMIGEKNVGRETPAVEKRRSNVTLRLSQSSAYRLVGDDQLDDRQGVEHSDGGDVPAKREVVIRVYVAAFGIWTLDGCSPGVLTRSRFDISC